MPEGDEPLVDPAVLAAYAKLDSGYFDAAYAEAAERSCGKSVRASRWPLLWHSGLRFRIRGGNRPGR